MTEATAADASETKLRIPISGSRECVRDSGENPRGQRTSLTFCRQAVHIFGMGVVMPSAQQGHIGSREAVHGADLHEGTRSPLIPMK